MSVYTYAVIDSPAAIDPVPGLLGMPVHNIPCRKLGVVVSELPEGDCPRMGTVPKTLRTAERVLEHSAVTDDLLSRFTVLPVRSGTVFPSPNDAVAHVEQGYADFCLNLNRLRAKLEFGLRVLWPGEAIRQEIEREGSVRSVPGQPGTAARQFLEAKLVQYRLDQAFAARAEQAIAAIDAVLHRSVVEKRYERLKTPDLLLSAYYLVEKARLGDFRSACQGLKHQRPEFKYLLSGPWPPYNFVVMPPRGAAVRPGPCDAGTRWPRRPLSDSAARATGYPDSGFRGPDCPASDAGGVQ